MTDDLSKILEFFRAEAGFRRILSAMYDTFARSGRIFGAVRLVNPSAKEEAALSEFFARDYFNQALIRISLADFERQIEKKFSPGIKIELGEILEVYMGVAKSTSSSSLQKGILSSAIASEILPKFENTRAYTWLSEIPRQIRREYRTWSEQYLTEPQAVIATIKTVANAINNLPCGESLVPISEFSQKFADPHDFDFHTSRGKLFLKALACVLNRPVPSSTEDAIHLHRLAGLITCGKISGAILRTSQGTQMLTLEDVDRLKFEPDSSNPPPPEVFVFEDPLIFSGVCERLAGEEGTLIAPAGEPGAAFLYLMEKFSASVLHYAGNMTIAGLEAADRLYALFGKNFAPWRLTREDFLFILEHESRPLHSEKKQLSLHNEQLASLLSLMRKTGKTASCAPLLSQYVDDIRARMLAISVGKC